MKLQHCGVAFLVIVSVAGCGIVPKPSFGARNDPACTVPGGIAAPAAGKGAQLCMVSTLEPGQEIERCHFFQVPREGWNVNGGQVGYTPGSHHVLLYTTPYKAIPQSDSIDTRGVFDCPFGAAGSFEVSGIAGGAQVSDAGDLALPPGVAIKLAPGAVVILNTHYLNATPRTVTAQAQMNLYTIPDSEVRTEAGILFFYNPHIRIPPLATASARMSCPVLSDVFLLNSQSHMHRRGVGYLANLVDGQGKILRELYRNDSWENVPIKQWSPPERIPAGASIDYRCDYNNPESRTVRQGLTTKDEMCMFLGVYHPRNIPFELCAPNDNFYSFSQSATFIGDGQASCGATADCLVRADLQTADNEDAVSACLYSACPGAARPVTAVLRCRTSARDGSCKTPCDKTPAACPACLETACSAPLAACRAAACN